MQLDAAARAFVEYLERVRRLSPATVRAYRADLADLVAFADDPAVADLDVEDLREWLWSATQRGISRASLARRTASLRGFFGWLSAERMREDDPTLRLVTPKRGRTLPTVAAAAELDTVLEAQGGSPCGALLLEKPFTAATLSGTVAQVLAEHRTAPI